MLTTNRRHTLYGEFHRRYPITLSPGDCVTHIVLHKPDGSLEANLEDLKRLCVDADIETPKSDVFQYFKSTTSLAINWEHHNEFVSYTFYARSPHRKSFIQINPMTQFTNWGASLSGELLTAVHVEVIKCSKKENLHKPPKSVFTNSPVAGGSVCDGHAMLWSDFHIYEDGFSKIAVMDNGLGPHRSGRLVQRLLDVETYRILAMLGFEYAERIKSEVTKLEFALSSLKETQEKSTSEDVDKTRLYKLLDLSAQTDDLQTKATPRKEATRAYTRLVYQRFEELNEERIQGAQRLSNFLRRRFLPSMDSSETTYERLAALTFRIQREAALLRARLDVSQQELNTQALLAMDRRMQLQLKLQQTVEALSIVAISYYAIGIFTVFAKAVPLSHQYIFAIHLTAWSAPFIILAVYICLRRARQKIAEHKSTTISESTLLVEL